MMNGSLGPSYCSNLYHSHTHIAKIGKHLQVALRDIGRNSGRELFDRWSIRFQDFSIS